LAALGLRSTAHRWRNYADTHYDFSGDASWGRKQTVLERMLEEERIESVVDIGANSGHYARIAARDGREVIAADFDPVLVDSIFDETIRTGESIYPVVLDFCHPTPGQGVDGSWFPPANERLRADLVLCFALSHHLIFGKYRLDFEEVARGIRSFARSWAIVEYVGFESVHPIEWRPDAAAWYSVDNFAAVLRRHFRVVEVLNPAKDGRRLLVCGPDRRLP
jgi:SAM-dependent methyltransferase